MVIKPEVASARVELESAAVSRIIKAVQPYTMAPNHGVEFAMRATVAREDVPGVIVECGTWRGGVSMAMMLAQKAAFGAVRKPVYMLDSFEGLPPVDSRDGSRAKLYQEQKLVQRFHKPTRITRPRRSCRSRYGSPVRC